MPFPLELILAIFLMKSYAEYWRAAPGAAPRPALENLGWVAVWMLASWLASSLLVRLAERRQRRGSLATGSIIQRYRAAATALRVVNLVAYWAALHALRWTLLVDRTLGLEGWPVAGSLAALLPFLAAFLAALLSHHRATRALSRATWSLREYLSHELRYSFFILVPWLFFDGLADLEALLPARARLFLNENEYLHFVIFGTAFAGLMVYFPEILRRVWRCRSLPAGALRERIEALCRRARLGYRDILLWPMGGSRLANAGVMGLVARHRYVLFTDALVEMLTPDECEAVLGHEVGHVRGRHMPFYLVFALGFLVVAAAVVSFSPVSLVLASPPAEAIDVPPYVWPIVLLVGFVVAYWRFLFGYVSRKLEREADLWGAELAASPVPLITALEKIALCAGGTRNVRSWRHHSVAERVRFLSRVGFDARAREEYHAQARRFARGFTAALALLAVLTAWHELGRPGGTGELLVYRAVVAADADDREAWVRRGYAALRQGYYKEAEESFRRANDLGGEHPRHRREACAGLAALYLSAADGPFDDPREALRGARRAVVGDEARAAGDPRGREAAFRLRLLARACARNGLHSEAVRHGERAQELHHDPDFEQELEGFRRSAQEERMRIELGGSA